MLVDLSKSNTFPVVEHEQPWYINGVVIGCYKPASVLKELPGLDKLDDVIFKGKYVRSSAFAKRTMGTGTSCPAV